MKVKRRRYYQTGGPDFIWVMDQNEKVGMFGFKILCVVDGFSRYPIHWKVRAVSRSREGSAAVWCFH